MNPKPLPEVPPSGFTPRWIETRCLPRDKPYEVGDLGANKGLRLFVTPQGGRSFRWYVESGGKRRKITFGSYPAMSLDEARAALREHRQAHREGRLTALLDGTNAAEEGEPGDPITVAKACEDFLASLDHKGGPKQAKRTLDADVIPVIGSKALRDVTRTDIRATVQRVVKRGSPVMARHVLALLRQFFNNWAVDEGLIDASPAAGRFQGKKALGTRKATTSRRYLKPDEIPAFWRALDSPTMNPTVRAALRVLLLTGLRTQELRLAKWSEVDFDAATLTVPVANQKLTVDAATDPKKAQPFVVPLPPTAVAILRDLRALADSIGSPWVLASFTRKLKGEDKGKLGQPITEKLLGHSMRRMFEGDEPLLRVEGEHPTPHDLRRSVMTHLNDTLRVRLEVCERALNHRLPNMAAIYAQGDYLDERREALAAWDAYVKRLLDGDPAKVVPLKKAAR